ncbi:MAG: SPFH domain-containing protein [Opitutales bacterium]
MQRYQIIIGAIVAIVVLGLLGASRIFISVPPGHFAVATLFGEVIQKPYGSGLHFPVNPLYNWMLFDAREKTHQETANVPSQDQLQAEVDVSVQFRLNGEMAPLVLQETGTFQQAVAVHLVPKLRSTLREQGKSIERAEDFFNDTTQELLQTNILETLRQFMAPKGIIVSAVLIRDITLPPFITRAIESKKEREQEVEKQKAELERFSLEQQQTVVRAEADREAAEQEAEKIRLLADAEADKIRLLNDAMAANPAYIQLQSLEALKAISANPSSKIYFMDGDSTQPLPLMNIGDPLTGAERN